ncbi:MAG: DUF1559 domain-containing protein [Planctomycetaceae bacterium]|jgi:prepilin-type N-terminal cleavage/methylation domain-containing protein/prepilin-type processing-associated H-X9-DG protein|nr:DUF1559 domain-containing protein [Planctomycetaceae bacterium]
MIENNKSRQFFEGETKLENNVFSFTCSVLTNVKMGKGGGLHKDKNCFNDKSLRSYSKIPVILYGFTLVELLVVISVFVVLVGLFLPTIQLSRDFSRRIHCANNLKQITIANQSFHTVNKAFPCFNSGEYTSRYESNGASVLAAILPFIGLSELYESIEEPSEKWKLHIITYRANSETPNIMPPCQESARTKVDLFRCPSDEVRENTDEFTIDGTRWDAANTQRIAQTPPTPTAKTNYVACNGSGTGYYYDVTVATDGVFGDMRKSKSMKDITDGASNTLLFSEAITGDGIRDGGEPNPSTPWLKCAHQTTNNWNIPPYLYPQYKPPLACPQSYLGGLHDVYADDKFDIGSRISKKTDHWHGWRGYAWIMGKAYSTGFTSFYPPNPANPDWGFRFGIGFYSARSFHVGGVNASYADGSVRFTSNIVDRKIWQKAGAINDGGAKLPVVPKRAESGLVIPKPI